MKTLLIILSLLVLTSCGKKKEVKTYHTTKVEDSEEVLKMKDDLSYLSNLVANNGASIHSLETLIGKLELRLTELETNSKVISIYDPCGDDPGKFDEVLFVLATGEVIAYFEHGNNRFLTILEDNINYQTTDSSKCKFVIHDGIITEGTL